MEQVVEIAHRKGLASPTTKSIPDGLRIIVDRALQTTAFQFKQAHFDGCLFDPLFCLLMVVCLLDIQLCFQNGKVRSPSNAQGFAHP